MTIKNSVKAACGALMIGAASQALAAEITLNASIGPGYLNNNAYVGTFDGSAIQGQFIVNSLTFSFQFADDASDPFANVNGPTVTTSLTTDAAIPGSGGDKNRTTTFTNTTHVTRTGEDESASLAFGVMTFVNQTTETSSTSISTVPGTPVKGATTYAKNNGQSCTAAQAASNSACKKTVHYTVTNAVTSTTVNDYTGNFALTGSLLGYDSLITSFMQTKSINFGLGVTGDLNLLGATISLDYTEVAAAAVPEPGSLALFGIGLLGFAGLRRNRRA